MRKLKGQALIVVIILVSVFLAIALAFVNLVIDEQVTQRRITNSIVAGYAAESAIEWAILNIKLHNTSPISGTLGDASYSADILGPTDGKYQITGRADKSGTKRAYYVELPDPSTLPSGTENLYPIIWKEINP